MFRISSRANASTIISKVCASCSACGKGAPFKFTNLTFSSVAKPPFAWINGYSVYRTTVHHYATTKKKKPKVKVAETLEDQLTPEESDKVLKVVNEARDVEDLIKYVIQKKKAEEVIKTRNESKEDGISLEKLISTIGMKNSSKFFSSVLNKPIPVNVKAAMFPVASEEEIQRISKVASIIIIGDKISWCLVERRKNENSPEVQLLIQSFQQINYSFKPRMHFLTVLDEMKAVVEQLPEAELYIVEEHRGADPAPNMYQFHLQMSQARSMVLAFLVSRYKNSKIIALKAIAVARMFNIYVGSEKVSGQHVVEDMLINEKSSYLRIDDAVALNYKNADDKVKEGLSQAIILNFAYWKLTQQIETR